MRLPRVGGAPRRRGAPSTAASRDRQAALVPWPARVGRGVPVTLQARPARTGQLRRCRSRASVGSSRRRAGSSRSAAETTPVGSARHAARERAWMRIFSIERTGRSRSSRCSDPRSETRSRSSCANELGRGLRGALRRRRRRLRRPDRRRARPSARAWTRPSSAATSRTASAWSRRARWPSTPSAIAARRSSPRSTAPRSPAASRCRCSATCGSPRPTPRSATPSCRRASPRATRRPGRSCRPRSLRSCASRAASSRRREAHRLGIVREVVPGRRRRQARGARASSVAGLPRDGGARDQAPHAARAPAPLGLPLRGGAARSSGAPCSAPRTALRTRRPARRSREQCAARRRPPRSRPPPERAPRRRPWRRSRPGGRPTRRCGWRSSMRPAAGTARRAPGRRGAGRSARAAGARCRAGVPASTPVEPRMYAWVQSEKQVTSTTHAERDRDAPSRGSSGEPGVPRGRQRQRAAGDEAGDAGRWRAGRGRASCGRARADVAQAGETSVSPGGPIGVRSGSRRGETTSTPRAARPRPPPPPQTRTGQTRPGVSVPAAERRRAWRHAAARGRSRSRIMPGPSAAGVPAALDQASRRWARGSSRPASRASRRACSALPAEAAAGSPLPPIEAQVPESNWYRPR